MTRGQPDAIRRAAVDSRLLTLHRAAQNAQHDRDDVLAERDDAIRWAVRDGMSGADVARLLGLTRARVSQITAAAQAEQAARQPDHERRGGAAVTGEPFTAFVRRIAPEHAPLILAEVDRLRCLVERGERERQALRRAMHEPPWDEIERLRRELDQCRAEHKGLREVERDLEIQVERLRAGLRIAIGWSYGDDVTPENRDELETLRDDRGERERQALRRAVCDPSDEIERLRKENDELRHLAESYSRRVG